MEVISIERSTYEELLTSFNSFVIKMKEMASRGNDKGLGDWLDNQDVCQMLNISPRTLQTLRDNGTLAFSQINRKVYYKPVDVESIFHVCPKVQILGLRFGNLTPSPILHILRYPHFRTSSFFPVLPLF